MSVKQYMVKVEQEEDAGTLTVWHGEKRDFDVIPAGCYVMTPAEYEAFEAFGQMLLGDVPIRFVEGPLE